MSELSTRIWLDERLWAALRRQAVAEGVTIAELIPRLVQQVMTGPSAAPRPSAPAQEQARPAEAGPPVAVLSASYRCEMCGAEVRLGGLSNHLGKHLKERQASETERS